jgi:hypothetical protein
MAIARAGRRRIEVEGRAFLWWVAEDLEEAGALTLYVASADKRFQVRYPLEQEDERRFLTVVGRELPGLPEARPSWVRLRCPRFGTAAAVTPATVRSVIDWCLDAGAERVQLDWLGIEMKRGAAS